MSITIKLLLVWFPVATHSLSLFPFLSPCYVSLEDRIIINSFGREIHGEHVKHRGCRTASSPRWVWVKGFVVQNADVDSPQWQQCITKVLPPHHPLNEWSRKMLFTPALSIRPFVGNKGNPFPYHLVRLSPLVLYVKPCQHHQPSSDECLLPSFTWKTRSGLCINEYWRVIRL